MSGAGAPHLREVEQLAAVWDAIIDVIACGTALQPLLGDDHPALGAEAADGRWEPAPLARGVVHYGNRPTFGLWVMCRAIVALERALRQAPTVASLVLAVRAVDNVLIAAHAVAAGLKIGHPPFGDLDAEGVWHPTPLAVGEARYGASPLFVVWRLVRAVIVMRVGWTGDAGPQMAALPDQPDEAPGLSAEAPPSPDIGADQQPRLGV